MSTLPRAVYFIDRFYRNDRIINEATLLKETDKTYTYIRPGERRETRALRRTSNHISPWFDTWDEAKAHLIGTTERRRDSYADAVNKAEADLAEYRALTNPETA